MHGELTILQALIEAKAPLSLTRKKSNNLTEGSYYYFTLLPLLSSSSSATLDKTEIRSQNQTNYP